MGQGVVKQGLRQQQKGLSERVSGLEQQLAQILFAINQRLQQGDARVASIEENVDALKELNGVDDVARIVQEHRVLKARAQAEQEKASLDEAIADGYVSAAPVVGEKSIIVVKYTGPDGVVLEPGRAQLVIPGVQPKFREQLLGKAAGLSMTLDDGGTCELLEIYDVDEAKAKEVMTAKQVAAQAQQAAATAASVDAAAQASTDDEANTVSP